MRKTRKVVAVARGRANKHLRTMRQPLGQTVATTLQPLARTGVEDGIRVLSLRVRSHDGTGQPRWEMEAHVFFGAMICLFVAMLAAICGCSGIPDAAAAILAQHIFVVAIIAFAINAVAVIVEFDQTALLSRVGLRHTQARDAYPRSTRA